MKTPKLYVALLSISMIIFSLTGTMANPAGKITGDILKKADKNNLTGNNSRVLHAAKSFSEDFSYLRFDVNDYSKETNETELLFGIYDYLYFDVNNFTETSGIEITDLPVSNEFENLRFDANYYISASEEIISEMPVATEFDYLRFDATLYSTDLPVDELPVTE